MRQHIDPHERHRRPVEGSRLPSRLGLKEQTVADQSSFQCASDAFGLSACEYGDLLNAPRLLRLSQKHIRGGEHDVRQLLRERHAVPDVYGLEPCL